MDGAFDSETESKVSRNQEINFANGQTCRIQGSLANLQAKIFDTLDYRARIMVGNSVKFIKCHVEQLLSLVVAESMTGMASVKQSIIFPT